MGYFKYTFVTFVLFLSCNPQSKRDFSSWYDRVIPNKKSIKNTSSSFVFKESSPLIIDSIYKPMQGPYCLDQISIDETSERLIWITGYECEIVDINSKKILPSNFMCHNNLNIVDKNDLPWEMNFLGNKVRLFTLAEGQTAIHFPKGFGIPVPANFNLEMVSQVLNHGNEELNMEVIHRTRIDYVKESEIEKGSIVPLFPITIFVTKQTSGPPGQHGLPIPCIEHHLDSTKIVGESPQHNCSFNYENEEYNPYEDEYQRSFTGHWSIPSNKEKLTTDVTRMMNLKEDTKIHFISIHLHPFAHSLEFWDETTNTQLFKSTVENRTDQIGIKKITNLSSKEGIPIFKDHRYKLVSHYLGVDSQQDFTAMATMCLYVEENLHQNQSR